MKQIKLNNWFLDLVLNKYFGEKEKESRRIVSIAKYDNQFNFNTPIPNFENKSPLDFIKNVSEYINKNLIYKSDPILFDYYTHPLKIQEMINNKSFAEKNSFHNDCDDFACYAFFLLSKYIDESKLTVVSIIPDLLANPSNIQWCHVLCVGLFSLRWSDGLTYIYTVDTNGLNWYQFKLESYQDVNIDDLLNFKVSGADKKVSDLILDRFSGIYSTKYKLLVNHGYPF